MLRFFRSTLCTIQIYLLAYLLTSVSLAHSQTPAYAASSRTRAIVYHSVPVCVPVFAGTHCAWYTRRVGQAEFIWALVTYSPFSSENLPVKMCTKII